jgi:ABC-type branched-subunit amino acid transport system substrate-binding protein
MGDSGLRADEGEDDNVRRTWWRLLAALAALTVLAAACSSDRGDDPTAAAEGDGNSETTAPAEDAAADHFGTLASPCGEGDASGATDQSVTDDQIVIGYGDDKGFSLSPGLSHETSDAIATMIDWCNEQGGINGRQIVGNYYDAAITNVVNATTEACSQVFMLVGEAWANDVNQEETRLGCGLPAVPTYAVSPEFANAPLAYQPVPNPADVFAAGSAGQIAELYPDEVKKASVMFADFAATKDTKDKVVQAFPSFGWKFLDCPQQYGLLGEADWKPFAQALKTCGAEVVYYSGQAFPNMQNLLDAAAQVDYHPIWVTDSNNYLQSFADWNTGGNGDKVLLRSAFVPFEYAEDGSATKQYMDLVTDHGGDISQLGMQATSAFLLWATAAKECTELTRQCVLDELAKITSWDGGGMHAESNPGENLPPECSLLLQMDGDEWKQVYPDEKGTFACDSDSDFELSGPVVDQAQLDSNRTSTKFAP